MTDSLGPQFLPGMEDMREAAPHEQTEHQFMNRPDVFVHGAFMPTGKTMRLEKLPPRIHVGFHAGSQAAARQMLTGRGPAEFGTEPRFFYGHVDRFKMNNPMTPIADQGETWEDHHLNHFYENEYEDPGSMSTIHEVHLRSRPVNYTTHRQAVSDAIRSGRTVPNHVRSVYEQTGGSAGSEGYHDPEFRPGEVRAHTKMEDSQGKLFWRILR